MASVTQQPFYQITTHYRLLVAKQKYFQMMLERGQSCRVSDEAAESSTCVRWQQEGLVANGPPAAILTACSDSHCSDEFRPTT